MFFYKVNYVAGCVRLSEEYSDHIWVTTEELRDFVDPEYYKTLKRFLFWLTDYVHCVWVQEDNKNMLAAILVSFFIFKTWIPFFALPAGMVYQAKQNRAKSQVAMSPVGVGGDSLPYKNDGDAPRKFLKNTRILLDVAQMNFYPWEVLFAQIAARKGMKRRKRGFSRVSFSEFNTVK